jgi:uncharacterized protein (DUF2147 family)
VLSCCIISIGTLGQNSNAIIGRWIVMPKQNLIVEIYKDHDQFKGKVVWFKDTDDKSKPMNVRTDEKNPDIRLRNRKLIGIDVLQKLVYNPKTYKWEQGIIYDATTGKIWNSSVSLNKNNFLKVRGFWHLEFFGRTMDFKRV